MDWLTISIVIPSFNQDRYLESTLSSVVSQKYPGTELIVIDGGSTDDSVNIIKKFESKISYWVSEPDGGQTQGLIKGFNASTGDIQCWLNSDDLMIPGTLREVSAFFGSHPNIDAVFGNTTWIDEDGSLIRKQKEIPFNRFIWLYTYNYIPGMSMFWRKSLYEKVGGLNPEFNLAMDADLWIRFSEIGRIAHVRRTWSAQRYYQDQKNVRLRADSDKEDLKIRRRYWGQEYPSFYIAKKLIAQTVRILWKFVTGCYSVNYRKDLNKYLLK